MKKNERMKRVLFFSLVFLFLSSRVFAKSIFVDTSTGRITVRATREELKEIEEMISQFPTRTRQIRIEAKILEVSGDIGRTFGTHLEYLTGIKVPAEEEGEGTKWVFGPELLSEIGEASKGALLFNFYHLITEEEKLNAILNLLITTGKARRLATPQVTTMSGKEAVMSVTRTIPYVSKTTRTETGEVVKEYSQTAVGVTLQVLPKIIGGDKIQMSIIPVVGDIMESELGPEHPIFTYQICPTNVTVKSDEAVVIGGLIQKKEEKRETGLPILSDLPIIGDLFKSSKTTEESTDLLIIVTPHILKPREIEGREKRIFVFKYALAKEIADLMRKLISSEGVILVNPKEAPPNSILIKDNEERVEIIQKMLSKLGTFEEQRREKVFSPSFSSLFQAKEVLSELLSSKGSIKIDEKSYTLTIEDGAYQLFKIEKAFSLLEEHNQVLQEKIFHLKYVKGKGIISKLDKFLSPRGSLKAEDNILTVRDNNWVIERISKELEKLDTFESQKGTRSYFLKYAEAKELLSSEKFREKVPSFLSPEATIKLNEEENALEITALKWRFEELDKLMESLDVFYPQKLSYELKYALASSLGKRLSPLLSDKGKIEMDEERNSLSIIDSPYRLKLIKLKLIELDTFEKEKKKEKIYLKYISLSQALKIVEKVKSPLGRIIEVDQKENTLVIEEASYPLRKIRERLSLEDTFDKQKVVRTYFLRYADPSRISPLLKSCFLSDKGEITYRGNKIIVIDALRYQIELEKIIPLLDLPKKS